MQRGVHSDYVERYFPDDYHNDKPEGFDDLFNEFENNITRLLIVGDPGSGKSVLLLEFALKLIERAKEDPQYPLPIMMDVTSWRNDEESFYQYLLYNITFNVSEFGISREYARQLLSEERLVLLLDGLDEIPVDHRETFLSAMDRHVVAQENALMKKPFPQLILSSRVTEFLESSGRIPVKACLLIETLQYNHIIQHLTAIKNRNGAAKDLYNRIIDTPAIADTLTNAFMIHMALSQADSYNFMQINQDHLLVSYIQRELDVSNRVNKKSDRYLSYLGNQIATSRRGVSFELSDISTAWVKSPRVFYFLYGFLFGALIFVAFKCVDNFYSWDDDSVKAIISGLLTGLCIMGLYVSTPVIEKHLNNRSRQPAEKKWYQKGYLRIITGTVLIYLYIIIISIIEKRQKILLQRLYEELSYDFVVTAADFAKEIYMPIFVGLLVGIALGTIKGIISCFFIIKRFPQIKNPYHRLYSEIKFNFVVYFLVISPIFYFYKEQTWTSIVKSAMMAAILSFIVSPLFKHLLVRIMLWKEGKTPIRLCTFLTKVSQTGLMEKDNAIWRFKHQLIQQYFSKRA